MQVLSTTVRPIPASIEKPAAPSAQEVMRNEIEMMMAAMMQAGAGGGGASGGGASSGGGSKTTFSDADLERAETCFKACQENVNANGRAYVKMLSDNYVRAMLR